MKFSINYMQKIELTRSFNFDFKLGLGARATSLNGFFTDYEGISWR